MAIGHKSVWHKKPSMAEGLGKTLWLTLPSGAWRHCEDKAEFYKVLVYDTGAFFKPHSEYVCPIS